MKVMKGGDKCDEFSGLIRNMMNLWVWWCILTFF